MKILGMESIFGEGKVLLAREAAKVREESKKGNLGIAGLTISPRRAGADTVDTPLPPFLDSTFLSQAQCKIFSSRSNNRHSLSSL